MGCLEQKVMEAHLAACGTFNDLFTPRK